MYSLSTVHGYRCYGPLNVGTDLLFCFFLFCVCVLPLRLVIVRVHQALRDTNSPGTVLGTPEFMAPELYTEFYDETVDIYAFGLVILEMISRETPYSECTNIGMIIHKVTSGVLPDVLDRVKIPNLKEFVQFCLGKQGTVYAAVEQGT